MNAACRRRHQSWEPYTTSSTDWLERESPDSTMPGCPPHSPRIPRISLRLSPAFSMLLHRRKPSFQSRISAFPLEACVPVTESRRVISKWAEQGSFEDS